MFHDLNQVQNLSSDQYKKTWYKYVSNFNLDIFTKICTNLCNLIVKPVKILNLNFSDKKGAASFSPWQQQGEGGGKEKRREREERKGEREEWKGERKEENRGRKGRKRGKRKRKRKECCAVSRPRRKRTQNCAIGGRFPPTLVILHLGAV